ncbi:hypothetical protein [Pedobacter sp. V48]|uniref:hypothetical protein n=1 Tax=Pedobacter sp. V48 TaxID=509635 RepID=UPI0003E4BF0E|nr:hypothetical protein [Pedobacter sp. V48]ETZ19142.1 hypothetical protein N824_10390 [Pedobacter sp. V48]
MVQLAYIKGIDKNEIVRLSEKIREAWNDYFLEYQYCQNRINFGTEERTNYMGDLLNYFDDTVELLEHIPVKANYQLAVYDTVSVLQLMYIGQDLIDELRFVFKMPASSGEDKLLIRTLRNELTGHPISRDKKNNFISSVFFTRDSYGTVVEYLRYHKDRDYKSEVVRYEWEELVRAHENYLLENLKAILATIKNKLKLYQNQLSKFLKDFPKISFEGIVNKTEHLFDAFFENSALYSKSNLLYFFENQTVHPRYRHCTDIFMRDLKHDLVQITGDIKEFRSDEPQLLAPQDHSHTSFKIVFSKGAGNGTDAESTRRDIRHQFSKLREKHPVFGIDYFIKTYRDDPEVLSELKYLQSVHGDEREFYCCYEYLRYLFTVRDLL